MRYSVLLFILLCCVQDLIYSQVHRPYFVDGYHGGIYGHYPLWVTQFMIDKLEKYHEWQIGLEIEPETWDTVKVKDPVNYERLKLWVSNSRVDFTNPTYAQPYMYNISGESIIRQFSYGIVKQAEHFDNLRYTTYAVEEPCFTSSLPQILKQFGFKYAVLKCPNTCWGGYTRANGGEVLNWVGSDGTAILTVPRYANENLKNNSTWQTTAWNNSEEYLNSSYAAGIQNPIGMTYQDAGWKNGPWLGTGNEVKNNSQYITWTNYFENITQKSSQEKWFLNQEDILVNLMWGSQVLQRIAQQVRRAENSIIQAEKIASMAYLEHGVKVNQQLVDDAWRTLMMAQHHDSWIVPYNKLQNNLSWAETIELWTNNTIVKSEEIMYAANTSFSPNKKRGNTAYGYVRVFNTLMSNRSEVIEVKLPLHYKDIRVVDHHNSPVRSQMMHIGDDNILQFEASVKGFGYSTYALLPSHKSPKNTAIGIHFDKKGNCILENDRYRLVLSKEFGGSISSLIVKDFNNREFSSKGGDYMMGEITGHFYEDGKFYSTKESPVEFKVLQDDALKKVVQIEGMLHGHPFTQKISLIAGQRNIDFDLTISWKHNVGIGEYKQEHKWSDNRRSYTNDYYKLKVVFPTDFVQEKVYKNAPFDVVTSGLDDTFFSQWAQIKNNVILNWVDAMDVALEYGLAVLTDHTSSYVHGANHPIGLTAQYSGVGLWGMNYKITEPLKMRYAIVPHQGDWQKSNISRINSHWNEPLLGLFQQNLELTNRVFYESDEDKIELCALYWEGDILKARLFNTSDSSKHYRIKKSVQTRLLREIKLNNEEVGKVKLKRDQTFDLNLQPFGLSTIQIVKK